MVRKHLIYWSLISVLLLVSCEKTDKTYKNISKYLKTKDIDIKNDYQKIVVITDNGCSVCTNFFSTTMLNELDNVHTLFIVTSKGTSTDIKLFLQKKDNVIVDWQIDINKYPEFSKTSAIFLGENSVDTIIKISAENIQEQIEFIRTK
jgi:hypothetical protein